MKCNNDIFHKSGHVTESCRSMTYEKMSRALRYHYGCERKGRKGHLAVVQSVTNIFKYSNIFIRIFVRIFVRIEILIRIYSDICSCQLFGYEYNRIFVRGKILIQIYSDIRSYQLLGHKQIQKMFLLIFSGYYTLIMDILLISMIKNAI